MLWTHGHTLLDKFIKHLNSIYPTIKFTAHISQISVEFLDTVVKICEDNTVITDLYIKPTDSHNYLHYSSCHPLHTKNSLSYSQLIHIKRICTRSADFEMRSSKLIDHFLNRGYPIDILLTAHEQVRLLRRGRPPGGTPT